MLLLFPATLTIPDPAGDARGDGGYVLPQRPAYGADGLDLRAFTAQPQGNTMQFRIELGALVNPWKAASGYSAGVTDIFVKTGLGGQVALADTGLHVRSGGWTYHLRVTGFGASLERSENGVVTALPAPTLAVQGTTLVVDAQVPAGRYGYWVTNSVFSPLTADGVLRPGVSANPDALQAGRADAPTPVDVLAAPGDTLAFTEGSLAVMGQTRDPSTVILTGLGGAGLLLTLIATVVVWRRHAR